MTASVLMLTYNHVDYIDQAIASIVRQRCDFDFNLIIADDASTDGTHERCLSWATRYPHLIQYRRNETNQGLALNFYNAYNALTSDFVAICEGDDFWLSKHKLQRQVSWLQRHSDYTIHYHRVLNLIEETGVKTLSNGLLSAPKRHSLLDIAAGNSITNVSVCFRRVVPQLPEWFKETPTCDYPLHLLNLEHGFARFSPLPMAVYRKHSGAIWSTATAARAAKTAADTRRLLIDYFTAKGRGDVVNALRPIYEAAVANCKANAQPAHNTPATPLHKRLMAAISKLIPLPDFHSS